MGIVVRFPKHHARASAGAGSKGYKSGRSSWRGTPETRSTASTRKGGTSSHCDMACGVIPSGVASFSSPPAASIARFNASLRSLMAPKSSIALPTSQASLHCGDKAPLYNVDMTLGNRIKQARERLRPKLTQAELGAKFGISDKAVSSWERDKTIPEPEKWGLLRQTLRVTYAWLVDGEGPPPSENDPRVLWDDQAAAEWAAPAEKPPPRRPHTAQSR